MEKQQVIRAVRRLARYGVVASLLAALLISMMPEVGWAQDTRTFLPLVASGAGAAPEAAPESPAEPAEDAAMTTSNRTYYVDIKWGNDSANGSLARPWKTLRKATWMVRAGDTVYVRGGDYRSQGDIYIQVQGAEGAPITFMPYPQEQVIVNSFTIRDSRWITIRGFHIIGPKQLPNTWRDMPQVVVDNPSVGTIDTTIPWASGRDALVYYKYTSYAKVLLEWIEKWTQGIAVRASSHVVLQENEITGHTAGVNALDGTIDLRVEHNRFHHLVFGFFSGRGDQFAYSVKDALIANNHFYQNLSGGVMLRQMAVDNVVEDNLIEYSGICHIVTQAGSARNLIRHNQLRYGGYYSETMENPGASAISIHSSGPGNRVEGNEVAYQVDVTSRDGHGIIVDYTPAGALVANNVLYRNMGNGLTSTHSGNNTFIHNTIVENGYNSPARWTGVGIGMAQPEDINNVIANNILWNNAKGGMYFGGLLDRQQYVGHNLFQAADETPLISDAYNGQKNYYSLDQLQASGVGAQSVVADAPFVAMNQGDFRLRSGSAAIDAGTAEYTIGYDKDNRPRPQGSRPDIGAFEYGS